MAQNIIRDQTREIGEMSTWLKQWYNTDPMTGMMHEGMMGGMDMRMLQGMSGDDFDRAFLMMMHEHHRGAVRVGRCLLSNVLAGGSWVVSGESFGCRGCRRAPRAYCTLFRKVQPKRMAARRTNVVTTTQRRPRPG